MIFIEKPHPTKVRWFLKDALKAYVNILVLHFFSGNTVSVYVIENKNALAKFFV